MTLEADETGPLELTGAEDEAGELGAAELGTTETDAGMLPLGTTEGTLLGRADSEVDSS